MTYRTFARIENQQAEKKKILINKEKRGEEFHVRTHLANRSIMERIDQQQRYALH